MTKEELELIDLIRIVDIVKRSHCLATYQIDILAKKLGIEKFYERIEVFAALPT